MPKFTWESIQGQPQKLAKLIGTIEQIDQIISTDCDPRLKDLVSQLRSLQQNPEQAGAKQLFESGMEMLGDRLGYVKNTSIGNFPMKQEKLLEKKAQQLNKPVEELTNEELPTLYEELVKIDGYQALEDQLDLVEPNTAGFVAESIRGYVYDTAVEGDLTYPGASGQWALYAGLYETVKGEKDWKRVKVSKEELTSFDKKSGRTVGAAAELEDELMNRSGLLLFDKLTNEQRVAMLRNGKNGAEISKFLYRSYIEGAKVDGIRTIQKRAAGNGTLLPEPYQPRGGMTREQIQKAREKHDASEKEKTARYAAEIISDIIACRAVMKLEPEEGKTFWDAGKVGKQAHDFMMQHAPAIVKAIPRKSLKELILKDTDGAALAGTVRKYVATLDKIPGDLPIDLRPSAKDRIEILQYKIKKEKDEAKKRQLAAEIIANREVAGARRGGAGLENYPDPAAVAARTAALAAEMDRAYANDPKSVNKLVAQATSGHGGKMTEAYNTAAKPQREAAKNATYRSYIDALNLENPTEKDVARLVAATSLYISEENGAQAAADPQKIEKIAEAAAKNPAFQKLMKDPNTIKHAKMGLGLPLLEQMGAKQNEIKEENQKQGVMEGRGSKTSEKKEPKMSGPIIS